MAGLQLFLLSVFKKDHVRPSKMFAEKILTKCILENNNEYLSGALLKYCHININFKFTYSMHDIRYNNSKEADV